MKIHLIQILDNHKQNLIRSLNHSEEIIIERTQVKVIDRYSGKIIEGFTLEGLGQFMDANRNNRESRSLCSDICGFTDQDG